MPGPAFPQQKIGQAGGFGGSASFLGRQNLPGQTIGLQGIDPGGRPGKFPASGGFNPNRTTFNPGVGGFGGKPGITPFLSGFDVGGGPQDSGVVPGFDFGSGGNPRSAPKPASNVISAQSGTGQLSNPFTNPELFSPAQLAGLNSGQLLFGGRLGPTSLAGMLGGQPAQGQQLGGQGAAPAAAQPDTAGAPQLTMDMILQLLQSFGGQ